jgi:hypothetical protein
MVVPLSAVKYYDVGGGACSCNFGAVNPPALGNFMAYGLIAAAGTAIIIVRRRKK